MQFTPSLGLDRRTFVRGQGYVEKGDHGTMRHDAWDEIEAKPDGVRLVERLAWTKVDGTALACERRTIIVHPVTNERELLVSVGTEVTPAPGVGALRFRSPLINGRPDAGYGGLTLRLPRAMTGGAIRTSTGVTGADAMGERADWLRYTGKLDGSGSPCGVAVFDHPANPRHPTHFFVRNAPFGVINPALCWDEEYVLEEGHDLSLRYGVWIHSGVAEDDRVSEVHSGWVAAT